MINVASAKLILLKDVGQCQKNDSVRITGIWKSYNPDKQIAIIEYNDDHVEIDTSHLTSIPYFEDEVIQCVGEISNQNPTCINARFIRSMNTIDMDLYEKVIELRNKVI
ncbi:telomere-capping, CST complex subunit-domain-containing protein [Cokeromyces recurvatus]|uniref:telomere-capping, CST complex subunit-domain-containing protein n=1 Tax=Cokeromyces recurvatus TaxID=90255 RepID=UPI00221EE8A4|nr:telomere-capping, CST complex subunit-domain-containing protein [Cokeromyces recurvatus]KAI7903827.1 telomere-capping, CST complex subunit-domain-containing protein [Cokeromyces recurvatus]